MAADASQFDRVWKRTGMGTIGNHLESQWEKWEIGRARRSPSIYHSLSIACLYFRPRSRLVGTYLPRIRILLLSINLTPRYLHVTRIQSGPQKPRGQVAMLCDAMRCVKRDNWSVKLGTRFFWSGKNAVSSFLFLNISYKNITKKYIILKFGAQRGDQLQYFNNKESDDFENSDPGFVISGPKIPRIPIFVKTCFVCYHHFATKNLVYIENQNSKIYWV